MISTFCRHLSSDLKLRSCVIERNTLFYCQTNIGRIANASPMSLIVIVCWSCCNFSKVVLGKASKKKQEKSGQADRLGRPPLPLPRSGQENIKNSRQVVIFGVILPFYKGQNGSKFSQNRSGQAKGGWPPPQAVSLTAFFLFFLRLP